MEIDPGRGTVPIISESRTILPIRAIAEALGANVVWNDQERKIVIVRKDTEINMIIGKKEMFVNGVEIINDVPPAIINSRTYLPLRFVAENLNCTVKWSGDTGTVTILYSK